MKGLRRWIFLGAIFVMVSCGILIFHVSASHCGSYPINLSKLKCKEKLASRGDAEALAHVQFHYMQNSEADNLKKWLVIGSNLNDAESIKQLFVFVVLGQLGLDDEAERVWLAGKITMLATSGDSRAATLLGEEYLKGGVVQVDVEAGKYWLRQASKNNEYAAIQRLSGLLLEDTVLPANQNEARELLETLYKISPPGSAYQVYARDALEKLAEAEAISKPRPGLK
jgi:TPR repeat protein